MAATLAKESLTGRYEGAFPNSRKLFEQARGLFPHGVTHDLRRLDPFPIYIDRAHGAYKWDVDDHQLIDYWAGHGSLLLGHNHPAVVEAVQRQIARATHPGACHELEIEWGSAVLRGRTVDVSVSGMFIESADPLWIGAGFTARLKLDTPLNVDCFVKRVEPGRGMGVAVVLPETQQQRYQQLLASLSTGL